VSNPSHPSRGTRLLSWLVGLLLLGALVTLAGVRLAERLQPPTATSPTPPAVETSPARLTRLQTEAVYRGSLVADQRVTLAAQLAATVRYQPYREGDAVAEGELLVRLDERELNEEIKRLEAAASRLRAELDFWREQLRLDQKLHGTGDVSRRARDETLMRVRSLEASLEEAERAGDLARVRLSHARVHAPFAGRIARVHVLPGDLAAAGRPMIELVAVESLTARVPVPQVDMDRLRPGLAVRLEVPALRRSWPARVDRVSPELDPESRTGTIEIRVHTGEAMQPGMAVEARVLLLDRPDVLAVPAAAVHRRGEQAGVYRVLDGYARWQQVRLGMRTDEQVEILEGLEADDPVIVTAHPQLRDGMPVRVRNDWRAQP
jgi:membrane fusion protein, multidrug efflux system